jgi:gluconate 2-dehydrogenase gamma chain
MAEFTRREALAGTVMLLVGGRWASAEIISGRIPFLPSSASKPLPQAAAGWKFLRAQEAATLEAIADRIIPPDAETAGGKDAGCVVFIDRQLAGGYGQAAGLYEQGPFLKGLSQQGLQSDQNPAQQYRTALAGIESLAKAHAGKPFTALGTDEQDTLLKGLEDGSLSIDGIDSKKFFQDLVTDVQQGFFADPIYGGNRDMCSWKMIGYPGARYDYRDWIGRHNEVYPYPPVSIAGRAEWTPRR